MATQEQSTIAQILYPDLKALDFAKVVAELDTVMTRLRGGEVTITWDCDDMVTFDVPETRILLAWCEAGTTGEGGCLTVSVGPNPAGPSDMTRAEHDVLCSRLVERIQGRFPAEGVLWHQVSGSVGSDLVDDLVDKLPGQGARHLPPIDTIVDSLSQADLQMAEMKSSAPHPRSILAPELSRLAMAQPEGEAVAEVPSGLSGPAIVNLEKARASLRLRQALAAKPAERGRVTVANSVPNLPPQRPADLERLRTALYSTSAASGALVEEKRVGPSTQMRLAAHCMNATLIVVYAPLGAAVMTYSLLRGENLRLSSRMMAVAGTLFALVNSPVGETMAAMAKGIG